MNSITSLSQNIVNKIAAGEVIERPASVVKELLENAIDAGATQIDIVIENGGFDRIRVVDDGCGIPADQLLLAVSPHATSKLSTADDLFRIATFGFRGEAIASIAEISQLTLRSRVPDTDAAAELVVHGGESGSVTPAAAAPGTTIDVRNLFFNTPVRRKFLKSVATEFGYISEAVIRIALATPSVRFTLSHQGKTIQDLPATAVGGADGRQERIAAIFGKEFADELVPVAADGDAGVRVSGFVGLPTLSRSNNRTQYTFLNHRHIRDRSILAAVTEAYRGLLTTGRFPVAFLWIDMPYDRVDVNVHPTKMEVRFQDSGRIYGLILSAIRNRFLRTDLVRPIQTGNGTAASGEGRHGVTSGGGEGDGVGSVSTDWNDEPEEMRRIEDRTREELRNYGRGSDGRGDTNRGRGIRGGGAGRGIPVYGRSGVVPFQPFPNDGGFRRERPSTVTDVEPTQPLITTESATSSPAVESSPVGFLEFMPFGIPDTVGSPAVDDDGGSDTGRFHAVQMHRSWIVVESLEGIRIIDQHAMHERILYERMKSQLRAGKITSQSLLVPEPVDLSPVEAATALGHREQLAGLGLKIEPFGGDTILVTAYPAVSRRIQPVELFRAMLDRILEGTRSPERTDLLDGLLETAACKAAVKLGDSLSPDEIQDLLQQSFDCEGAHHCPHGRPSVLVLTNEELARHFNRI